MPVSPYLHFQGNCREAMAFYQQLSGGELSLTTWAEMPGGGKVPGQEAKIMHAELRFGGTVLMGSDPPQEHYRRPQGFAVNWTAENPADAERIFAALAQDGQVGMPLGPTFFAARFGMVVDRFGVPWIVYAHPVATDAAR